MIKLGRRGFGRRRVTARGGYARDVEPLGEVRTESGGDRVEVVVLSGEHDLGTVPKVRDALGAAAGNAVIVDLCAATFVDSSILGAMLEARRSAIESDRGFAVACDGASEPVRRVLEVTGLAEELPVHASREDALAAVGAREKP